jgi:hypothetical protein
MHLAQARLVGLGPIDDTVFRFRPDSAEAGDPPSGLGELVGVPRKATVVLGGGGVGKTTLLAAIASTRPGHAIAQRARRLDTRLELGSPMGTPSFVVTEWALGLDDPARPHTLRVMSPNGVLPEPEDVAVLHRREQAVFDRKAQEGGFALIAFSGARWFSKAPLLLGGPDRTIARHDPKALAVFDDPTRADLSRETKHALALPLLASYVARNAPWAQHAVFASESLERAIRASVGPLARLAGHTFLGVDPASFEPVFERATGGALVPFDELPIQARSLIALPALVTRALHAAYAFRPGSGGAGDLPSPRLDAREAEGVALIDDAELHLDAAARRGLVPALREALPNVQWVLATASPDIASSCEAGEVLALRRMEGSAQVELYEGELAVVH